MKYTKEQKIDYMSSYNQRAIERWLEGSILLLATDIIRDLCEHKGGFSEIINEATTDSYNPRDREGECENCGESVESYDLRTRLCEVCYCANPVYIHQWYFVSDYLSRKLEEMGEIVVREYRGRPLWGRRTTGQSIRADEVIGEIAKATGILAS